MILQDELDQITSTTRTLVQADRLAISEQAISELFATGIAERILPVGAKAPEFALPDSSRRIVRSSDLLSLGPLVINFFRGRWCPYCMTELEAWRDLHGSVRERGALLVAISPQAVRQNDFAVQQHSIPFPMLSDAGAAVAQQLGLAYRVSEFHQRYFRSILVNIPYMNGDQSWQLPLPATYVISQSGTVLFAEAHADFRVRPEPAHVLAALDASRSR